MSPEWAAPPKPVCGAPAGSTTLGEAVAAALVPVDDPLAEVELVPVGPVVAAGLPPVPVGDVAGGVAAGGVATGGVVTGGVAPGGVVTGGVVTGGVVTGGVVTGGVVTGGVVGGVVTGGVVGGVVGGVTGLTKRSRIELVHVTVLPPPLAVPLHWLMVTGRASVAPVTEQVKVLPPPVEDPLHWLTVEANVLPLGPQSGGVPPPPLSEPMH